MRSEGSVSRRFGTQRPVFSEICSRQDAGRYYGNTQEAEVEFDNVFFESSLIDDGTVDSVIGMTEKS